jgi:hypothetical protein
MEGVRLGVDIAKTKDQLRIQREQSKDVAKEEKSKEEKGTAKE